MDEGEEPIRPKEDNSGFDVPTENIRQGIEKGKPTLDKASIKDNINRYIIYSIVSLENIDIVI